MNHQCCCRHAPTSCQHSWWERFRGQLGYDHAKQHNDYTMHNIHIELHIKAKQYNNVYAVSTLWSTGPVQTVVCTHQQIQMRVTPPATRCAVTWSEGSEISKVICIINHTRLKGLPVHRFHTYVRKWWIGTAYIYWLWIQNHHQKDTQVQNG